MDSNNGKIRLLVVEDCQVARYGLRLTFEKAGDIEVIDEAEDGSSALEKCASLSPDIVLLDVGLPVMDGLEAAAKIKGTFEKTKIIMFTSHDSPDEVFVALSAGVEGYCLKNVSAEQLVRAVRAVNTGVMWLDAGVAKCVLKGLDSSQRADQARRSRTDDLDSKFPLTPREMEVLELLVEGMSNQQIAEKLVVSAETVKTHVRHIMEKLAVADRTQAAVKALREGWF